VHEEFDLSQSNTTDLPDVNFEDFFSLPTTNSPSQDDFKQSTGSATPSVKSSPKKVLEGDDFLGKMAIDNTDTLSSAATQGAELTATQPIAEHDPPGDCVTVFQGQSSDGTSPLQRSSGEGDSPVSLGAVMESPKPLHSASSAGHVRGRGRPRNLTQKAVTLPGSSTHINNDRTSLGRKRRAADSPAKTRGSGRVTRNKRLQDSTTEVEQTVKRAKTMENGMNKDQGIQQPGELPKEWKDGAIQEEEIQPPQDLPGDASAPEAGQCLDEAAVDTTLQHILSFRPDLKRVPDDWLHQHRNQEDPPCDSQNSLQADADDCDYYSVAMHNAVGMELLESVDDILVRYFFHTIRKNISCLHVAHGKKCNLICLRDELPPECAREYSNQSTLSKIQDTEAAMKEALASAKTLEDFATSQQSLEKLLHQRRIDFELHRAQISTIGRAHATVEHLLELNDVLRTSDRSLTAKLEEADAFLERVRYEVGPLEFLGAMDEFKIFVDRGLASSEYLHGQREKRTRLLEAVQAAGLRAFADDLKAEEIGGAPV
jgi:hypothetical protein